MKHHRMLGLGLLGALALTVAVAPSASGSEYNLHALPEIGRCAKVGKGGEYRGSKCIRSEPAHGNFNWFSGAGAKKHFVASFKAFRLKSSGNQITCASGTAEGEYTGPKNFRVPKLVLQGCQQSIAFGAEGFCQNSGATNGEITTKELEGDLGFISHPKKLKMGWDLKPVSESNLVVFECGGANEVLGKSLGTGVTRELQGSVIGKVEPIDKMSGEQAVFYEATGTTQTPQHFEGGVKDTLTTLVGPSKTPEATALEGRNGFKNEEALEILGRCAGTGC
jgi:hypothetical protein